MEFFEMRSKFIKIIKAKIKEGDLLWFPKNAVRMASVVASAYLKKNIVGPVNVTFVPSWRCNSFCKMCEVTGRSSTEEMDIDEFKRITDELADMGASVFSFMGGEPFMREDILEMISYVKSKHLITQVSTNGIILSDKNLARKLIETDCDIITLSLDCNDPIKYRQIRGVDKFNEAVEGIKNTVYFRNLLKKNIAITINFILMNENIDDAMEIIKFIKSMNVDLVATYPVVEYGNIKNYRSKEFDAKLVDLFRKFKKLKGRNKILDISTEYLDYMIERITNKRLRVKCFSPISDINIDPLGNVFPCMYLLAEDNAIGNIRGKSIKEFWYSKEYAQIRMQLANCNQCDAFCSVEPALFFNKFWFRSNTGKS
jgi:MoaA/NifB/PqqE/SkfB family radical SAM enzyme